MKNEFGLKDLYDVAIKSTYLQEINGKTIEAGETIAFFDKISLANFQEIKSLTTARGGYNNSSLVIWENTKEVQLNFTQGVFSKQQFSLLMNSKMLENNTQPFKIYFQEELESDESGVVTTSKAPSESLFMYRLDNGEKIQYTKISDTTFQINSPFTNLIVNYYYLYTNNYSTMTIGQHFCEGCLLLTGKTRVKDDVTGHLKTGILTIPKLKLTSSMSMRLGDTVSPVVGRFEAIALPVGVRGHSKIMELNLLDDDIDSDI